MEDDTANNSKAEGHVTEPSPQAQPSSTHEGTVQPSQPVNDEEQKKERSNALLLTSEAEVMNNKTFQGTHKQQSENCVGIEERKERGLPGSAPGEERANLGTGG